MNSFRGPETIIKFVRRHSYMCRQENFVLVNFFLTARIVVVPADGVAVVPADGSCYFNQSDYVVQFVPMQQWAHGVVTLDPVRQLFPVFGPQQYIFMCCKDWLRNPRVLFLGAVCAGTYAIRTLLFCLERYLLGKSDKK